jgi:hypothetical protein
LRTSKKTLSLCAALIAFLSLGGCASGYSTRDGETQTEAPGFGRHNTPSETMIVDALVRDGQLARGCVMQQAPSSDLVNVQPVELNGDQSSEYIVEGVHSCTCAAQRCYYWVYGIQQKRLRLLAAVEADFVEAGLTRTNGWRDLMVYSAYGGNRAPIIYEFDGASYANSAGVRR